jgi:hypothetical protein
MKFYTLPSSAFTGIYSTANVIERGLMAITIYDDFRRMWKKEVTVYVIP